MVQNVTQRYSPRSVVQRQPSCEAAGNLRVRLAIYELAAGSLYLTVPQVSKLLGIAEQTVRNQMSQGAFPLRSIRIGRRRLFPIEDVVAFAGRSAS